MNPYYHTAEVISHVSDDIGYDVDYSIDNGIQATIRGSINTLPVRIPISIPHFGGVNRVNLQAGGYGSSNLDYNYDAYIDDYIEY